MSYKTFQCFAMLTTTITVLSTLAVIARTLPLTKLSKEHDDLTHFIQLSCLAWFIFEASVRFITFKEKKKFLRNATNLIDAVTITPDIVSV